MNEPVAWAYIKDGDFYDAIHPDERKRVSGLYNTPLYTATQFHPAKTPTLVLDGNRVYLTAKTLTNEEIWEIAQEQYGHSCGLYGNHIGFARAILRKAQEK